MGDRRACLRLGFVLDYLLSGRMVFLAPLHFGEGWHILSPLATLGKDGVGFNDASPRHRCQSLRDRSVLCQLDLSSSLSL